MDAGTLIDPNTKFDLTPSCPYCTTRSERVPNEPAKVAGVPEPVYVTGRKVRRDARALPSFCQTVQSNCSRVTNSGRCVVADDPEIQNTFAVRDARETLVLIPMEFQQVLDIEFQIWPHPHQQDNLNALSRIVAKFVFRGPQDIVRELHGISRLREGRQDGVRKNVISHH